MEPWRKIHTSHNSTFRLSREDRKWEETSQSEEIMHREIRIASQCPIRSPLFEFAKYSVRV